MKQQEAPKNSQQAVGIPKRKGNAETHIADGVNGERVSDGPHASGENRPDDQVRRLADIGAHMRCPANQCGNAPACQKNAADHHERHRDRRDVRIHQLDGRFGASEPCSGCKSTEDAQAPASCANGYSRLAFAPPITLETAAFPGWRSTEFIQEHEAAQKDAEGNPEMHVSGNGANETTEARSGHCSLEVEFESGPS